MIIAIVSIQYQSPEKGLTPNNITLDEHLEVTGSITDGSKWYYKDIIDDSIVGIGLEKAVNEILYGRKGKPTTVALIDGRFDINHPALKNYLWKNPDEQINYLEDDGNGFVDDIYGNNHIFTDIDNFDHGTRVSGTITSVFDKAGAENLKIMGLRKSPFGDYYDKDLALAIRYAVNKGARVINMSFGKLFTLNNKWVIDAMKYAEENNVLLVCSAENTSTNNDEIIQYPSDTDKDGNELVSNLISVGASGPTANENLRAFFSSYGKENVDVFAPGLDITSAFPVHNINGLPLYYDADGGTSISAALTSGVAALLFSYYPKLTAKEVKQILMESGIKYTFAVKISPDKENDSLVPFNALSKSGKIINVYNALLMAEDFSK